MTGFERSKADAPASVKIPIFVEHEVPADFKDKTDDTKKAWLSRQNMHRYMKSLPGLPVESIDDLESMPSFQTVLLNIKNIMTAEGLDQQAEAIENQRALQNQVFTAMKNALQDC